MEIIADQNSLQKLLNEQRQTGQFCDVIFKLGNDFQTSGHFCVIAPQSGFVGNKYFLQESMQFSIHNPLMIEIINFDCKDCLALILDYMYLHQMLRCSEEHVEHIRHLIKLLCVQDLDNCIRSSDENSDAQWMISKSSEANSLIDNDDGLDATNVSCQYRPPLAKPSQSKMHQCYGCPFKCYKPAEMLIHLNNCQKNNSICPLCDCEYENFHEFRHHLARHDNNRPFYCNASGCNLRFYTKTALNMHMPKHSVETPYLCPICSKGFKWKHGLNSHLIVHSDEKKLLCDECGYSTSHLKTLRTHQLSHTGFVFRCTSSGCSYTSRRKENLKIHTATHKNETPFVCEICGHRFSQNKNLKRHALIHVAKSMHKCPHCQFSSYRTDKVKDHINRLHTEKPLQLELSEDVQSALLKDMAVPSLSVDSLSLPQKKPKCSRKKIKKHETGKTSAIRSIKLPVKLKPILPMPEMLSGIQKKDPIN